MASSGIKRFIASATCPLCHKMDTIVVYLEGEDSIRECVRCGFRDSESWNKPPARGLATRVAQGEDDQDVEIVRIVMPDV